MPECARCGDFTDNPAEKQYQYCTSCNQHFSEIRESGVIVRRIDNRGNYEVSVTVSDHTKKVGGRIHRSKVLLGEK